MNYYLDTDTCIFALRGQYASIKKQIQNSSPDHIKIPSMVHAELLLGALKSDDAKKNVRLIDKFLEPYDVAPFNTQASIAYAKIRYELEKTGHSIGPNDLIIAAIVITNQGTLITHNIHEFSRVPGLLVEDWTA